VFRRRGDSPETDTQAPFIPDTTIDRTIQPSVTTRSYNNDDSLQLDARNNDPTPQLSALVRQRKATVRRAGIAFSNTAQRAQEDQSSLTDLILAEEKPKIIEQASRRFTVQTGQVADTHNVHM